MKSIALILVIAGAAILILLVPALGQMMEEVTKEKILAGGQEWQEKYDTYDPPSDMVEALKSRIGPDTRIDVYLGLWCPDSRNNVPLFAKIMDRLSNRVPVRYYNLPRKPSKDIKYFIEDLKVERVPTFIFYAGGKEIGRIVENPKIGMIEDVMEIFFR